MNVRILGLGTAAPVHSMPQPMSAEMAVERCSEPGSREAKLLPQLFRMTSVKGRGSVVIRPEENQPVSVDSVRWFYPQPNGEPATRTGPTTGERMREFLRSAPPLAIEASRRAMEQANTPGEQITHLVTVTCTGFGAPGLEVEMFRGLKLRNTTQRIHVGFMGCHAALNGIQVAAALAASDPSARVLLCCVELCSLHFQYGWDSQRVVSNALFADGAAAMIVAPPDEKDSAAPRITSTATSLLSDTEDQMSWHVEDHGFVMGLSSRVPGAVGDGLRPWVDDWLATQGLTVEQVGSWAIHAGGPRIVTAVAERLALPESALVHSRGVLSEHGNMSSATVLFILQRMLAAPTARPLVMLAFGPGLFAEAALLR
jgi:predicted naringenin-chalcone synthase